MKVLMVCLGNICRSPLAEGVLQDISDKNDLGWEVDSAGTSSWHAGESPHQSSIHIAKQHGIDISHQRSRAITKNDLDYFDLIITMDNSNYSKVSAMCKNKNQELKLKCLLDYSFPGDGREVPDPYYTNNFSYVFDLIQEACLELVETNLKKTSTYSRKA